MKLRLRRIALAVLWAVAGLWAAPVAAQTAQFDNLLIQARQYASSSGHLCASYGVADVACPTFAPTLTATGDLTLSGLLTAPNATFTGDVHVGGNFTVSGSQTIDGVTFANGGISASSITVGNVQSPIISATYLYGQYVSGSEGFFAGLAATTGSINSLGVGNMAMTGNLTGAPFISTAVGGTVTSTNVYAYYISGTSLTAADATFGGLTVNGTLTMTGATDTISATNVYASSVSGTVGTFGTFSANSVGLGNLAVSGNVTGPLLVSTAAAGVISSTNVHAEYTSATHLAATTASINSLGVGNIAASGNMTGVALVSTSAEGILSATNVYAQNISATSISATTVYGQFVGDGSGLINVVAASSDRIISGTSKVIVNNGGNIGFYTGSTLTGYYTPSGVLTSVGVSTTGMIKGVTVSATALNAEYTSTTNLTATNATLATLTMTGLTDTISATNIYANAISSTIGTFGSIDTGNLNASGGLVANMLSATTVNTQYLSATQIFAGGSGVSGSLIFRDANGILVASNHILISATTGAIGIGTEDPATTLDVSGSFKVSGDGTETCDATHIGTIRRDPSTGRMQICQ